MQNVGESVQSRGELRSPATLIFTSNSFSLMHGSTHNGEKLTRSVGANCVRPQRIYRTLVFYELI